MAYWQRKQIGVRTCVAVYYRAAGSIRVLPRVLVKDLDERPDDEVDEWVRTYFNSFSKDSLTLPYDKDVALLAEKFLAYLAAIGRTHSTISEHRSIIFKRILPYFASLGHTESNPERWFAHTVRMQEWLLRQGVTPVMRKRTNITLKVFYRYLVEEGVIRFHPTIVVRNPVIPTSATPLRATVSPNNVLEFVDSCSHSELKIIALIGYGFSLRPQEIFALRPIDFIAGQNSSRYECARTFSKFGLFNRLLVNITRQRNNNEFRTPKSDSRGLVACFDEQIARVLVKELADKMPHEQLFKFKPDWYYELWRRNGIDGITIKDLRRSSILYLGHHTELDLIGLKSHARHKDPATTALYLRRPLEETPPWQGLDVDI